MNYLVKDEKITLYWCTLWNDTYLVEWSTDGFYTKQVSPPLDTTLYVATMTHGIPYQFRIRNLTSNVVSETITVLTVSEDTHVTGNMLTKDVNTSVVKFTIDRIDYPAGTTATLPNVGSVVVQANGFYSFTPTANYNGTVPTLTVTLSDGSATVTAPFTITVTPVNDAPSMTSSNMVSVAENQTSVLTATASDPDANTTFTYSITGGVDASKFTINATTGALAFITVPNFESHADSGANNVYEVTVQVSDGTLTATQAISVTVTNVNEPPFITSSNTVSVAENQTFVLTVTASDPDANTTFTYSITGGVDASKFTINATTGALAFITLPNFESPDDIDKNNIYEVTVQVSDGTLTATQTIFVTVTNVNETPFITSSNTVSVAENQTSVLTVTASDPDANTTFTYSITGGADANQFNIGLTTGVLTFKNAPNRENPTDIDKNNVYEVTVQVSDGTLTATQAIFVTVTNVNEPPFITSSNMVSVAENQTSVLTVTASDPDANTTFTYIITGGADANQFDIGITTGVLAFKTAPVYDTNGNNFYNVTIQVSDGMLTSTKAIAVNVMALPINSLTVNTDPTNPRVSWSITNSNFNQFTLQIATDSTFTNPTEVFTKAAQTSYTVTFFGTYYFRVKAFYGSIETAYTTVGPVTFTSTPPTLDVNTNPADPHVSWSITNSNFDQFTLQYATDSTFTNPIEVLTRAAQAGYIVPFVGTLYFRVKAFYGSLETAYTTVGPYTFISSAPPTLYVDTNPTNPTVYVFPSYPFNQVTLQYATDSTFTNPTEVLTKDTQTSYTVTFFGTYYFRAKAFYGSIETAYTTVGPYTFISSAPPTLYVDTNPISPKVFVYPSYPFNQVTLQYATDSTFTNPTEVLTKTTQTSYTVTFSGTYYFRAKAFYGSIETAYKTIGPYTISYAPLILLDVNTNPANPRVSWSITNSNFNQFTLQYATNSTFTNPTEVLTKTTQTSYTVPFFGTYYFRVKAFYGSIETAYTTVGPYTFSSNIVLTSITMLIQRNTGIFDQFVTIAEYRLNWTSSMQSSQGYTIYKNGASYASTYDNSYTLYESGTYYVESRQPPYVKSNTVSF